MCKEVVRFSLAFVCLLVAGQASAQNATNTTSSNGVTITFLHVNDVHNRIEGATASASSCVDNTTANNCFGGYARLMTAVNRIRNSSANPVFLLDAGDEFMGTLWDTVYKGQATAVAQNLLRPDAMTLGNHEFDFGGDVLAEYLKVVRHPVLACNMDVSKVPALRELVKPYTVLTKNAVKVGVVGLITEDTATISSPPAGATFSDPIKALPGCIKALRTADPSVGIIVVLSHVGYQLDQKIAEEVADVDLIIGGHSHTFLFGSASNSSGPAFNTSEAPARAFDASLGAYPTMVTSKASAGKKVPVVHAFFASRYLGNITATFDAAGELQSISGQPILLGPNISSNPVAKDPAMQALIAEMAGSIVAISSKSVGTAATLLDQSRARDSETNLGSYLCDALIRFIKKNTTLESTNGPVNICFQNGGGIRASIRAGPVTVGDIITVLPFSNIVTVKKVSGQTLLDSLAHSPDALGTTGTTGRFLQVAGVRYAFDPTKAPGSRLVRAVLVNPDNSTAEIDPAKSYNVVLNEFTARGGDGFTALGKESFIYPAGPPMEQVIIEDFARNSPLSVATDGRIVDCNRTASSSLCSRPITSVNTTNTSAVGSSGVNTTRSNSASAAVAQALADRFLAVMLGMCLLALML